MAIVAHAIRSAFHALVEDGMDEERASLELLKATQDALDSLVDRGL